MADITLCFYPERLVAPSPEPSDVFQIKSLLQGGKLLTFNVNILYSVENFRLLNIYGPLSSFHANEQGLVPEAEPDFPQ